MPAGNRRERKKTEARERIIGIALKLFQQQGFSETTVAQIMEEADLGTGTFYNYFQSKEDLVRSCVGEKISEAVSVIQKLKEKQVPPAQKLSEIIQTLGEIFAKNKPLLNLFMQVRQTNMEMQGLPSHTELFSDIVIDVFTQGQKSGEFNIKFSGEAVAETIFGILWSNIIGKNSTNSFFYNLEAKINILFEGILNQ